MGYYAFLNPGLLDPLLELLELLELSKLWEFLEWRFRELSIDRWFHLCLEPTIELNKSTGTGTGTGTEESLFGFAYNDSNER